MQVIATYHGACLDGSAAAAVLKMRYPQAKLVSVKSRVHQDAKEEVIKLVETHKEEGVELYMLDNPFFAREFAQLGVKLTIIDHHIGEHENLSRLEKEFENVKYIFDNNKSGASLAWGYFFEGKQLPKFIWHIEDGDIWRLDDEENTGKVESYASIYLDKIDKFIEFINADIEDLYKKGEVALAYRDMLVDYYMRNANALHLKVGKDIIKAYNVASLRPVVSQFGNLMSQRVKEPVVMFKVFGNTVNLSFRSASEKWKPYPVDLAQSLGGNGHKLAAGATMPLDEFVKNLQDVNKTWFKRILNNFM